MNIKESIIHYIDVYDGSEKRILENVISSHQNEFSNESQAKEIVHNNLMWLVENGYISIVKFEEMTDMQRRFYESDDFCSIYKTKKRYSENEYLKSKYGGE